MYEGKASKHTFTKRRKMDLEDSKIIELFFERSEQAIIELSDKYGKRCTAIASNILNDLRDAEECVNDAYLAVWNSVPPEKPNPLLTYLCKIVRNLAIKRYRANTAKKRNSHYDIAFDELCEALKSKENIETELEEKRLSAAINGFLESLDKENRIIFVRRYYFSESISDIALLLGISNHAVSVKLSRLRERLKKRLTKEGFIL